MRDRKGMERSERCRNRRRKRKGREKEKWKSYKRQEEEMK